MTNTKLNIVIKYYLNTQILENNTGYEMTYTVTSGTLNSTIPYHTGYEILS